MAAVIDMHMHTVLGAYDSSLQPEELGAEAVRVGLSGVHITEHDRLWDRHTLARYRDAQAPLLVVNGMEVSTDMGHVIAVGLTEYVPRMRHLAELRRLMDEIGGYIIAAHPFRHYFEAAHFMRQGKQPPDLTPEALARLPVFQLVDAIEALNGLNTPQENVMALRVAKLLGKPVTGGSDCHSRQGIGYYCTLFEDEIETPQQLLAALRAGRFHAGHGLAAGKLRPFTETSLSEDGANAPP